VAGDDRVVVFQPRGRLRQSLAVLDHAAAVAGVDKRNVLARERVAGVHHPRCAEEHPRVSTRVRAAKVIEIDLILPAADLHGVLERPLRQETGACALEDVHVLHVRLRVLLRDDVDGRAEELVAAGVVRMRVRVDDERNWLVAHRSHFVEDRLSPVGELGVDNDDAGVCNEGCGVPSSAGNHVEVVFDLLYLRDVRSALTSAGGGALKCRGGHR